MVRVSGIARAAALLVLGFGMTPHSSTAGELDYFIKNGQFFTSDGAIPKGCFANLMTELNGDDVYAAVFISRTQLRGCQDANSHYNRHEQDLWYEIENMAGDDVYAVKVCQSVDGSMGSTCGLVHLKFKNRPYFYKQNGKKVEIEVLAIEKLGEE